MIEARIDDIDRALDAIRLQYPAYWRTVSGRFLSRTAVRLELEAYQRMASEGLLSSELLRHLVGELRTRLESFEAIPPLDLGLDVDMLIRNVPLARRARRAARADLRATAGAADRASRRDGWSDEASAATPCTSSPPARSRCSGPATR